MPRGGLEQETILVVPWRRIKHVIQPLASKTPAPVPPSGNNNSVGWKKRRGVVVGANLDVTPGKRHASSVTESFPRNASEFKDAVRTVDVPPPTREVNWADGEPSWKGSTHRLDGEDDESPQGDDEDDDEDDRRYRGPNHPNAHQIAITIPHGFQQIRTLLMPKPTIRSVLYVSSTHTDAFAAMDSHGVHLVRGTVRVMNLSTAGGAADGKTGSSVAGLSRWIYVKRWRMTIIATLHLELKILGLGMEVVSSVSSVKPVLSLEFNEDREELIAGGVGNIRIWTFTKTSMVAYQFSGPRLVIDDLATDEWVTHTIYHRKNNRLYVACENHIMIYDYNTGKRIETIRNAHELSISAMCIYEPLEYLITGSRDSAIKVWTRHGYLILELRDHSNAAITGAVAPPTLPFLVSCSMDGMIRMWNLEAGHCVYRLETPQECLGLSWMRRDTFYHYSKDRVTVWNLNRYYSTFSYLNSQVTLLSRVELRHRPARILAAAADGSIRLLSPVTGAVLTTAFPAMKETMVCGVEYDLATDILWALSTTGDVAIYACRTNPCRIIDEWKCAPGRERITCFSSLRASPLAPSTVTARTTKSGSVEGCKPISSHHAPAYLGLPTHPVFALIAGTDTGQILMVDPRTGRQEMLVQAHTADVTGISCINTGMSLITSASDGTIKIWRIAFTEYATAVATQNLPTSPDASKDAGDVLLEALRTQQGPLLTITPISTLSTSSCLTLPACVSTALCFSLKSNTLAIGTDVSQLLVYRCKGDGGIEGLTRRHPADEDHTKTITSISCLEALGLFATSSLDGTVKIWDSSESALVREIQFNEPLSSVTFCNRRGDLLVGMSDQIALVKLQDFLPSHYLGLLLSQSEGWPDDPVEYPNKFDSGLDFWELYRQGLENDGADLSHWHVQNRKPIQDLDGDTMKRIEELEKKRAIAEANRRKRRLMREKELERLKQQVLYTVQAAQDEFGGSGVHSSQSRRDTPKDDDDDDDDDDNEDSSDIGSSNITDERKESGEGLDNIFKDIQYEEDMSFKKFAGRERRKSIAPLGMRKAAEKSESNAKKLKEMYANEARGGRRGSVMGGDDIPSIAPPGAALRLKFLLPQVTGSEGGARQTGPLRTLQEIQSERMGNMAHSVRLERPPVYVEEVKNPADARAEQIQAARQAAMAEVANPFVKYVPAQVSQNYTIPQRESAPVKHWIRERMAKMGILPNSVVTAQIQEDKRRKMREMQEERERKEKERQSATQLNANPFQRPKHLQSRRPKKPELVIEMGEKGETHVDLHDDVEDEKEDENAKEAQRQKDAMDRLKKIELEEKAAAAERAAEREREAALELAKKRERERLEREEAEALERARREEEERLQREAEEAARAAAEAARMARLAYMEEEAKKIESRNDLREKMTIAPRPLKKKVVPPTVPVAEVTKAKSDYKKPSYVDRPRVSLRPKEKDSNLVSLSEGTSQDDMAGGSGKDGQKRAETTPSPPPKSPLYEPAFDPEEMMEKKMEAKHAWGLFDRATKNAEDIGSGMLMPSFDDVSPELSNVINNFWFPGLGGKPVNLVNIIEVLFKLMKNGLWSEKCEASKAVLYLYHTFERDFLDPMTVLIYPQLEFTNDEAWQFRAQMCLNLVGYKIYHPDIVQSLICRLNDKVETVRKVAKKGLAHFGINSKSSLRNAMIELHMLPPQDTMEKSDWLDILLERMNKQLAERILETNDIILQWRNIVHPSIQGRDFERPPSSWVTLVRPASKARDMDSEEAVMEAFRNTGNGMSLSRLKPGRLGSRMMMAGMNGKAFASKTRLAASNFVLQETPVESTLKLSMHTLGNVGANSGMHCCRRRAVEFPMHASRMASGIRLAVATERQIQQLHHHYGGSGGAMMGPVIEEEGGEGGRRWEDEGLQVELGV
ncbi:hypothetical protein BC829DRAFT_417412 [Chytridium lagenaria]|nr:hypothetical protein BC829DRAFT_417412 [Chytridium lagenaria]